MDSPPQDYANALVGFQRHDVKTTRALPLLMAQALMPQVNEVYLWHGTSAMGDFAVANEL